MKKNLENSKAKEKPEVLTINDVAEMLRIPLSSARKLAAQTGVDFPKSVKVGRHRRWLAKTLEAYLNGDPDARA